MRYVSMFSGIEAASVALEPLGWEPMAFCEIEPFPCAVLAERFPDVPNLGDVKEVDWHGFEAAHGRPDVVVGGSPCQSFSVAGTRTGLDGPSGLMREYVRAIRDIRPRWLLWENVPGALSSSHGEDFGCLLRELDALGYGLAWRVLDAQFFGVAQRRERVFLVGRLGDVEGPCQVLFEREGLLWDPPSSREKRQELAARAGCGAACAGFGYKVSQGAGSVGYREEQSPTLLAGRNDAAVIQLKGNAIDRDTAQNGRWACDPEENGAYTLNATDVDGVLCMADTQANSAVSDDVSGTITAHSAKDAPVVARRSLVRRLTPRECERLQGFPDDWTLIPYRGKPAEECPDTPRYKAIGNSMAVPVMRWIGERMALAERVIE